MDIILLGAGGQAKDFIKNIEEYNSDTARNKRLKILGLIDDYNKISVGYRVAGYPVFDSFNVFKQRVFKGARVICAVGDPVNKTKLIKKAQDLRLKFFNLVHPGVHVHRTVKMGEGVSFLAFSVVSAYCRISDHVSVNYLASVSHDCAIGDYATICPGVNIGGGSVLGQGVFMGIGSCCMDKKKIGRWTVVGAGAVVVKDVTDYSVVVGNPASSIAKRKKGIPVI